MFPTFNLCCVNYCTDLIHNKWDINKRTCENTWYVIHVK